jgi:hypothetical protein
MIQGVQFLSWFAWFPFLCYISRYVLLSVFSYKAFDLTKFCLAMSTD